ncbi:MAG: MBL fold metallo-hydrolase [Clostridiales bacterium]|jgi:phosphoribosyl 1,2-cyclic phosphodiesterase|nr:MBL fold metallo-hydrolase [Clostridiales bacterium]MDY4655942.1 MBL fold metallo-hydrolase [Eubacteriales bacterium]
MAITVCSLGSGSKGNCVLISDGKTRLLIDAGLNAAVIAKKLSELGLMLTDMDGLLITHEHGDHIRSVDMLAQFMPVYSHPDTLEKITEKYTIPLKYLFEVENKFSVGTLDVTPFDVSHDAVHPYGYSISDWESKFTYLTDTGYVSKGIMNVLKGSDIVMLESNHDKELLLRGVYPERLKRRIMSEKGHLSNAESALTAFNLAADGTKTVILAHLSEQNNLPELAYWTTKNYLRKEMGDESRGCNILVATQKDTVVAE